MKDSHEAAGVVNNGHFIFSHTYFDYQCVYLGAGMLEGDLVMHTAVEDERECKYHTILNMHSFPNHESY